MRLYLGAGEGDPSPTTQLRFLDQKGNGGDKGLATNAKGEQKERDRLIRVLFLPCQLFIW
jgi:hypothetical protein